MGDVWGENYQARVHDNKIYVNIKRLRRLLEKEETTDGDGGSAEFLLRGKNGYYINPKARINVIEKETTP